MHTGTKMRGRGSPGAGRPASGAAAARGMAQRRPAAALACRADLFDPACPSRRVLELIAEKWAMLLIDVLGAGPQRPAGLRRQIGGISEKMLIQTLRRLQRCGFVERHDFAEVPPRVEYRLTPLGRSLAQPVRALDDWIERHLPSVREAEALFDASAPGGPSGPVAPRSRR